MPASPTPFRGDRGLFGTSLFFRNFRRVTSRFGGENVRRYSDRAKRQARGDEWKQAGESSGSGHGTGGRLGRRRIVLATAVGMRVRAAPARAPPRASTITVGSVLPISYTLTPFGQVQTRFNTHPAGDRSQTGPPGRRRDRPLERCWGEKAGPFYLRVLHPTAGAGRNPSSSAATPMGEGGFTSNVPDESRRPRSSLKDRRPPTATPRTNENRSGNGPLGARGLPFLIFLTTLQWRTTVGRRRGPETGKETS